MVAFGLDISHHQDLSLDLARAKRDGCEFVFLKATEGKSLVDADFASNLAEARAAGMLVGAYVFVRANATPAEHVAQARKVIPRDVPVILDVETAADKSKPSLQQARAVLDAFRADGWNIPLTYIPLWYWRDVWGSPWLDGWPPLWSSRYPDMVVGTLADEWADVPDKYWNGYGNLPVAVLQFTSSARIAGYQPLDANAYRGTRDQLAALLGQRLTALPAPFTPVEETSMEMPAGTHVRKRLFAAGRPHYLWWEVSGQDVNGNPYQVIVHDVAYIKRTPNRGGADYGVVGQPGYPKLDVFDKDRPGPIQFADDVAFIYVEYSCPVESTAAIG